MTKGDFNSTLKLRQVYNTLLNTVWRRPRVETNDPSRTRMWPALGDKLFDPRARDLLWRIGHEILTVRQTLKMRGMNVPQQCGLCNRHDESVEHLFVFCPVVAPLWHLVNAVCSVITGCSTPLTVDEVLYLQTQRSNVTVYRRPVVLVTSELLGAIWSARNANVFKHRRQATPDIKALFLHRLRARIKADFSRLPREVFASVWCVSAALCVVNNDSLIMKI